MNIISTDELRALIDSGEPFALIMAMNEAAYAMGHIPGSFFATQERDLEGLQSFNAPIVVYCTGPDCAASGIAYRRMRAAGYRNVSHYIGGLAAWEAAGLEIAQGRAAREGEERCAPKAHRSPSPSSALGRLAGRSPRF